MSAKDLIHSEEPLNAEPSVDKLVQQDVTANELVFHRNHGSPPPEAKYAMASSSSSDEWRIELCVEDGIIGLPKNSRWINLNELKRASKEVEQTIALQCAGNRRELFSHGEDETEGIAWGEGTIANVVWAGTLLRPLLEKWLLQGQSPPNGSHVVLESYQDCGEKEGGVYGGSVQSEVLWQEDASVLLAWKQNGRPLDIKHGGPVRVVVPGHIGARSVKWLARIKISPRPAPHHAQQQDYKVVYTSNHDINSEQKKAMMSRTKPMGWSSMQCVIGSARLQREIIKVRGYAVGEMGVPIKSIHVAVVPAPIDVDKAEDLFDLEMEITERAEKTSDWQVIFPSSTSTSGGKNWGWTLWEGEIPVPGSSCATGKVKWAVVAKAVDAEGNEQTRWPEWNIRGVGFDGWSVRPV